MLTQPRLIRLCTSDATLYFQSVCNAIFLDASDSFGSMYVVWVKHGTLVGVRGLGRNTPWLTFVWSLSDIYYLEPTSQPRTLSLEHAFFPQSPVWRIAVPISHFISIDSDKNADLKLNGQLFPPKMMVETKSELKNKKCILDFLPDCQKKTT